MTNKKGITVMKRNLNFLYAALAATSMLALTACGGGSSSPAPGGTVATSTSTSVVSTLTVVTSTATYTLTNPPVSNYAVGSAPKAMFDQLNQVRIGGGYGALEQSVQLDQAAKAHADYVAANYYVGGAQTAAYANLAPDGTPGGHIEIPGVAGFTGARQTDRASFAGYSGVSFGEEVGGLYGVAPGVEPDMRVCLSILLNTVFHRAGLLQVLAKDVGFGISGPLVGPSGFIARACVIELGSRAAPFLGATNFVGIYPFDAQLNTPVSFGDEIPDPIPTAPIKGGPVSIQVGVNYHLTVNSFVLRDANGLIVNSKVLTILDFPKYLRTSEAYLVPIGALQANATYYVTFSGSSSLTANDPTGGVSVNRSWSFRTGSN